MSLLSAEPDEIISNIQTASKTKSNQIDERLLPEKLDRRVMINSVHFCNNLRLKQNPIPITLQQKFTESVEFQALVSFS